MPDLTYEQRIDAVLEAFKTTYQKTYPKSYDGYRVSIPEQEEEELHRAILPHIGQVPSPAATTEIFAEICELYRLDGRTLAYEGEEYEPDDTGYAYVLADREHDRENFIRYLIQQIADKE